MLGSVKYGYRYLESTRLCEAGWGCGERYRIVGRRHRNVTNSSSAHTSLLSIPFHSFGDTLERADVSRLQWRYVSYSGRHTL